MIKLILKRFPSVTELKCKTTMFSARIEYLRGNADWTVENCSSLVIEHFNPGGALAGGRDLPATQRLLFLHSFGN